MPMYEYKCTNEECEQADERVERLAKLSSRDEVECKSCGTQLTRQVATKTAGPHISWSLWRV